MFWENLTEEEANDYGILLKKTSIWIAWINTKPEDRIGPEPNIPTDEDWLYMDKIQSKGWNQI